MARRSSQEFDPALRQLNRDAREWTPEFQACVQGEVYGTRVALVEDGSGRLIRVPSDSGAEITHFGTLQVQHPNLGYDRAEVYHVSHFAAAHATFEDGSDSSISPDEGSERDWVVLRSIRRGKEAPYEVTDILSAIFGKGAVGKKRGFGNLDVGITDIEVGKTIVDGGLRPNYVGVASVALQVRGAAILRAPGESQVYFENQASFPDLLRLVKILNKLGVVIPQRIDPHLGVILRTPWTKLDETLTKESKSDSEGPEDE